MIHIRRICIVVVLHRVRPGARRGVGYRMAPTRPIDSITDSMLFAESFVRRQQSLGIDGRTESISAVLGRSERTWRRQLV